MADFSWSVKSLYKATSNCIHCFSTLNSYTHDLTFSLTTSFSGPIYSDTFYYYKSKKNNRFILGTKHHLNKLEDKTLHFV